MQRTPVPPFTLETALQKVQAAEDAWQRALGVRRRWLHAATRHECQ